MKPPESLSRKDNVSFFNHIARETLIRVRNLNQRRIDPSATFESIIRKIIINHAKRDPDFFLYRFQNPDDLDLCAQTISIYLEANFLRYFFEDDNQDRHVEAYEESFHEQLEVSQRNLHTYLEGLDDFQAKSFRGLEVISQNPDIDPRHLMWRCQYVANTSIARMENAVRKKYQGTQKKRIAQFLQRSDDYYIINTLLSSSVTQLAERLFLRKRLQAILAFQLDHESWETIRTDILIATDGTRIKKALLTKPLLLQ